jgi:uncharacterized membrane protein
MHDLTLGATSKNAAQERTDDVRVFHRELERLEHEGVLKLDDEIKIKIRKYHDDLISKFVGSYDVDEDVKSRQLSLGMRAASLFGALALAASVFFLFRQFWGDFGEKTQAAILIVASFLTFALTMVVSRHDSSGYFTKLAAMVAFACFVLNISMLGGIFNITPSDRALLVWAGYGFLLAYAFELRLLLIAGILCITAYIAARTGTWSGLYWISFGERPENFFPAAVLLFITPQLINHEHFDKFAGTYRIFGLLTALLPILVLANWPEGSYLDWGHDLIKNSYQVLGFVLSAAAVWLGVRKHWPEVVNTGATFFVIFLYTKFYDWWWEMMPKYLFFLVVGLTAVLFLAVMKRLRSMERKLRTEASI